MEWTKQKMEEVCDKLQKKAVVDETFRKELLADPEKAIETLTGEKPPEGFRLKVIEHDPAYTATMILPELLGRELTDEESDAISGGVSFSDLLGKAKVKSCFEKEKDRILGAVQESVSAFLQGSKDPHLNRPIEKTK